MFLRSISYIFVLRFKKEQLLWTKSAWPRMLGRKSLGLAKGPALSGCARLLGQQCSPWG